MNKLSTAKRSQVVAALVEGNSVRNLKLKRIQCDEIWEFVGKAKNVHEDSRRACS